MKPTRATQRGPMMKSTAPLVADKGKSGFSCLHLERWGAGL
jgi:hypothetical protein